MSGKLLTCCINNFTSFLNQNFDLIVKSYKAHKLKSEKNEYFLVSFEEYFDDWAQANWELLVERVICSPNESLVIYGSGSDYEAAAHSRVFFQKAQATHEIICSSTCAIDWISKAEIDLSNFYFESFVSPFGGWCEVSPPFDYVLFTEKGAVDGDYVQVVIPRNQLEFSLQAIEI